MTVSAYDIAQGLTKGEQSALLAVPIHDRGNFSDESWWAFYSVLEAGLIKSDPGALLVLTPLGREVMACIRQFDTTQTRGKS